MLQGLKDAQIKAQQKLKMVTVEVKEQHYKVLANKRLVADQPSLRSVF
jgi:hypothetical protein